MRGPDAASHLNDASRLAAQMAPSLDGIAGYEARIRQLEHAIAWALGEQPDAEGRWFEPDAEEPRRPDGQPVARYWWRTPLRRMSAMPTGNNGGSHA